MRAAKGENKSGFGDSGSDSGGNMRQLPLIQQLLNSNEVQMPMQHLMSRTIWVSQQSLAIHKLLHTNLEDTARKSSIQAAMREIHMENRKKTSSDDFSVSISRQMMSLKMSLCCHFPDGETTQNPSIETISIIPWAPPAMHFKCSGLPDACCFRALKTSGGSHDI